MVVREFDQQPADSQIDRCLRYYELLQNCFAAAYSTTLGLGSSRWRTKRATPTLTLVTNGTLNGNGAGNAVTSIANVVTTPRATAIGISSSHQVLPPTRDFDGSAK